jgi:hypothetical protein
MEDLRLPAPFKSRQWSKSDPESELQRARLKRSVDVLQWLTGIDGYLLPGWSRNEPEAVSKIDVWDPPLGAFHGPAEAGHYLGATSSQALKPAATILKPRSGICATETR